MTTRRAFLGTLARGLLAAPPTDEAPKEGQLDPEYAAGKAAIMIMIDTADTLQTDRAARTAHTVTIHKPASRKSGPTDGPRNRQGH